MVLFNADGELCGYGREVPKRRRPWELYIGVVMIFAMFMLVLVAAMADARKVEKEHVTGAAVFRDAVRVDCPAGSAYAHASECIRARRGVGFFFVDDNGIPRVVPVVGVGRFE